MRCFICDGDATDSPYARGGRSVDCEACGAYSISGAALYVLNRDIRIFDEVRAREWLGLRRADGQARPLIEPDTDLLRN